MPSTTPYELETLESLITNTRLQVRTHTTLAKKEFVRIRQAFSSRILSPADDRQLERYIQYHQEAIIRLMDTASMMLANPEKKKLKRFLLVYYHGLEGLLAFIERHCARYFDQDAKAPEGYLDKVRARMQADLNTIHRALAERQVEPGLTELLLQVLRKPGKSHQPLTYRRALYALEVQAEIHRSLSLDQSTGTANEDIRHLMIYLNYNARKVFANFCHYFHARLATCETSTEKLEWLSFMRKQINQVQIRPGIAFHTGAPTLKGQLTEYLSEEIDYLVKLQHLNQSETSKPNPAGGKKVKLQLSVAQLACFLRILIESKLIITDHPAHILQAASQTLMSRHTESISVTSLRTKYYEVETGTVLATHNILKSLLQLTEKMLNLPDNTWIPNTKPRNLLPPKGVKS